MKKYKREKIEENILNLSESENFIREQRNNFGFIYLIRKDLEW